MLRMKALHHLCVILASLIISLLGRDSYDQMAPKFQEKLSVSMTIFSVAISIVTWQLVVSA